MAKSTWSQSPDYDAYTFVGDYHNPTAGGVADKDSLGDHYLVGEDGQVDGHIVQREEEEGDTLIAYSRSGYVGRFDDLDKAKDAVVTAAGVEVD